jgi:hypothetical protein
MGDLPIHACAICRTMPGRFAGPLVGGLPLSQPRRRREVAEELGLDRPLGPVLAVDWVPSRPERPEGLIVVYNGGVLSDAEIKEIVLADGEFAGFAFVPLEEVSGQVTPLLARRVASCLDAVAAGAVAALENGSPAVLTCTQRRRPGGSHGPSIPATRRVTDSRSGLLAAAVDGDLAAGHYAACGQLGWRGY